MKLFETLGQTLCPNDGETFRNTGNFVIPLKIEGIPESVMVDYDRASDGEITINSVKYDGNLLDIFEIITGKIEQFHVFFAEKL
jgi:hypothetical protein